MELVLDSQPILSICSFIISKLREKEKLDLKFTLGRRRSCAYNCHGDSRGDHVSKNGIKFLAINSRLRINQCLAYDQSTNTSKCDLGIDVGLDLRTLLLGKLQV